MADVLVAHDALDVRFAIHQNTPGFYADERRGRRALLAVNGHRVLPNGSH